MDIKTGDKRPRHIKVFLMDIYYKYTVLRSKKVWRHYVMPDVDLWCTKNLYLHDYQPNKFSLFFIYRLLARLNSLYSKRTRAVIEDDGWGRMPNMAYMASF